MSQFASDYARCYELLYADKDYKAEAEFVISKIEGLHPRAASLLEVGCGTGKHAHYLASKFNYSGFDLSQDMIELAKAKNPAANFHVARLPDLALGQSFDVVVALFHVMSYINANADFSRALSCLFNHLNPGGLFLFDVWYGPAVLNLKPQLRVKRVENDEIKLTRIAEPEWRPNEDVVNVRYDLFLEDLREKYIRNFREDHAMRYFFRPEMSSLLEQAGFNLVESCEWLSNQGLSENTWGACFIAQKPK